VGGHVSGTLQEEGVERIGGHQEKRGPFKLSRGLFSPSVGGEGRRQGVSPSYGGGTNNRQDGTGKEDVERRLLLSGAKRACVAV